MKIHREFLKSDRWKEWENFETDQNKKIPVPPVQKAYPEDAELVDLVKPENMKIGKIDLFDAIQNRKSRRKYSETPLNLDELSFLLWATQGVRQTMREGKIVLKTVPSGGARHPFETYLYIQNVDGLKSGLYRYLGLEHKLYFIHEKDDQLHQNMLDAFFGYFVDNCAVAFIWTCIPYRTEWRYSFISPKVIAQDSGHLCQNLYLACEAINCGTVGIDGYDQNPMDRALAVDGVDGEEEFAVYSAVVGKVE